MPRKPVDVRDYDRQREGQQEHVSEYTRMQEVRGTESAPSMLALHRPRPVTEGTSSSVDAAWERRHYVDTHYPDATPRPESDPARPWDRVLWGLGEMAADAGIVKDAREGYSEAGNIWHYPTASFDDSYSREQVIDGMEATLAPQFGINAGRSEDERLERTREELDFSRHNYWRVAHAEREIPTKDELDRTVDIELDAAIKNDFPGVRRNSKKYKELYESHKAGTLRYYTQRGEEAKARAVAELERERSDMGEPARKARSDANYQLRRVAWVEALKPGSERAARERRIVERQLAMADEYDRNLNEGIARVKSLAVGRPGIQPAI